MLLTFGEAEGEDADFDVASLAEFFGTGDNCRASGDHIIDDEQMLTLDG